MTVFSVRGAEIIDYPSPWLLREELIMNQSPDYLRVWWSVKIPHGTTFEMGIWIVESWWCMSDLSRFLFDSTVKTEHWQMTWVLRLADFLTRGNGWTAVQKYIHQYVHLSQNVKQSSVDWRSFWTCCFSGAGQQLKNIESLLNTFLICLASLNPLVQKQMEYL